MTEADKLKRQGNFKIIMNTQSEAISKQTKADKDRTGSQNKAESNPDYGMYRLKGSVTSLVKTRSKTLQVFSKGWVIYKCVCKQGKCINSSLSLVKLSGKCLWVLLNVSLEYV